MAAIAGYRARATASGHSMERVITVYEAGWSGFWLARWIMRHGMECKTLSNLRVCLSIVGCAAQSLMALTPSCYFGHCSLGCAVSRACVRWCRSQTRPMSMPRRCVRERTELISERVGLTNRIGAVLADALCERLQPIAPQPASSSDPSPGRVSATHCLRNAQAKIERLLARLELGGTCADR